MSTSTDLTRSTLVEAFEREFGPGGTISAVRAPGRCNLLGEHTDYNNGLVLPIAVSEYTSVLYRPSNWPRIAVYSDRKKENNKMRDEFPLTGIARTDDRTLSWSNYVRGVAAALTRRSIELKGGDLYITSTVPVGAGLSSSAALEVASGLALLRLAGKELDLQELAFAGSEAENTFAGANTGIMDQTVVARAREGCALLIDCRSLEIQNIPVSLPSYSFALFDSGVRHKLRSSEYNQRRAECEHAAFVMRESSLRDVRLDHLLQFSSVLTVNENKRVRHVMTENQRVAQFAAALTRGDILEIGRLLSLSHASLQLDYEVSSPELDAIVESLAELNKRDGGCPGARLTGGGFGGAVVALVKTSEFDRYAKMLKPLARGGSRLLEPSRGICDSDL
jgi:galactokinase